MYTTPAQLITQFNPTEIIELSVPERFNPSIVSVELLQEAIAGNDLSGHEPEAIEAVEAAIDTIEEAINYSEGEMDSYFQVRYSLPFDDESIELNMAVLTGMGNDITRYRLAENLPNEQILERYKMANTWLRNIATGKSALKEPVSDIETETGTATIMESTSRIDWDKYAW